MSQYVVVGLSGGVDSAVSAWLLKEQGYRVEGLFMKNWEEDDDTGYCAAAEDLASAEAVARCLDIPLHVANFSAEYWDGVFDYFLREYQALRTPNPDVLCNREIKFKAFLDHAQTVLGADRIATGHYAHVAEADGYYHLQRCADENKDQTYFLHLLDQHQLAHALMPLAKHTKTEVRDLAKKLGLPNASRKDSTGICFIGERRFREFLSRYIASEPGPIETADGVVIGEHQGLSFYTLGQRQGLGVGGITGRDEAAWYVAAKDPKRNALVVVQEHDHPLLMSAGLTTLVPHWIAGYAPAERFTCLARIRHRQPLQACTVQVHDTHLDIEFEAEQRAVCPGQSVVLYNDMDCLGGAVINAGWSSVDAPEQFVRNGEVKGVAHEA